MAFSDDKMTFIIISIYFVFFFYFQTWILSPNPAVNKFLAVLNIQNLR